MPIFISQEEKTALQDYFNHPDLYISAEDLASLPGGLPDGTKVSRAKPSDEEPGAPRRYLILSGMDSKTQHIPITTNVSDDPGTHSATMLNGKIYFHQNKDDLPKKLPDNFEDYFDTDEEDDPEDESVIKYRAAWERALGRPDYVLNVTNLGVFKKTVKYAVDIEGNVFYLKSQSSFVPADEALSGRAEQYAPQLYMGQSIIRRKFPNQITQTKRIYITRDSGENLEEFMLNHIDELGSIEIELLAREILTQYLVQINEKLIVHTDIKAANICVKITQEAGRQFEVVFIDWDEAFSLDDPSTIGDGTPGYMAPEFFNTPQDCERQLENRGIGVNDYCDTLKSNYKNLFSKSSDIFALGVVLLDDLQLEHSSPLYHVVNAMCHNVPAMRPSGESIKEALECSANRQAIATGHP